MRLSQRTTSADPNNDAPVPGASTTRRFHCHSCRGEVILCSGCDRGNIYCKACAGPRLVERLRKARAKYRQGRRGKGIRAAAEKRRRARRMLDIENSVGDRGSPPLEEKGNAPVSEPVGSDTGEPFNEDSDVRSHSVGQKGLPPASQGLVRCACCGRLFVPFQPQGPRRGCEKKLLRARAQPAKFAHGGGAP